MLPVCAGPSQKYENRGEAMTLSEAYEALLKLPLMKGCIDKNGVCQEDGKALYPCSPASKPAQNVYPLSWHDYIATFVADH